MDASSDGARYVTDVPYARRFVRELSPAWLDFTALICGVRPPERTSGFTWCELGCGHGVTPALLATTHPEGQFLGIDLMPQHTSFATELCREAGIENARFEALDFAEATALDLPAFDYIVAHGVYTWVDAAAQADLLRFVERHLKPGGLVYLSYDCLPGWAGDMPLQHLLLSLAAPAQGDSIARLDAADQTLRAMMRAGGEILKLGAMGREWSELRAKLPPAYFVHQLLPPGWKPLYVTEVRRALAGIDLTAVGSATIRENVDAFILDKAQRDLVNATPDPDLRELLRDYLLMKRFRRDVFGRDPQRPESGAIRNRILETYFMRVPSTDSPFTDATTQRILSLLGTGVAAPSALLSEGVTAETLAAQIIALVAAGTIWPVDREHAQDRVARMNAVLERRAGGPDAIDFRAAAAGTAMALGIGQKSEES